MALITHCVYYQFNGIQAVTFKTQLKKNQINGRNKQLVKEILNYIDKFDVLKFMDIDGVDSTSILGHSTSFKKNYPLENIDNWK